MRHPSTWSVFLLVAAAAVGCGVTVPDYGGGSYGAQPVEDDNGDSLLTEGDNGDVGLADDGADPPPPSEGQTDQNDENVETIFPAGTTVVTTSNLNLRKGPGTTFDVLRAMAEGAELVVTDGSPQNGFLAVSHEGLAGFASYRYLRAKVGDAPGGGGTTTPGANASWRDRTVAIAAAGVGLSYWWGHGRLYDGVVSAAIAGSCSGNCPSCDHAGTYGADCSGYVAKAWVVPAANDDVALDTHPYSTADFNDTNGNGKWADVAKSAIQMGDAMVYRSGGGGHVFIYDKGDAWGQPWAYESRGCAYKVAHNIRTAGTAYKAITKTE